MAWPKYTAVKCTRREQTRGQPQWREWPIGHAKERRWKNSFDFGEFPLARDREGRRRGAFSQVVFQGPFSSKVSRTVMALGWVDKTLLSVPSFTCVS